MLLAKLSVANKYKGFICLFSSLSITGKLSNSADQSVRLAPRQSAQKALKTFCSASLASLILTYTFTNLIMSFNLLSCLHLLREGNREKIRIKSEKKAEEKRRNEKEFASVAI